MNEQKKAYRKVLREFRHYRRKALGSYSGKEIWERDLGSLRTDSLLLLRKRVLSV